MPTLSYSSFRIINEAGKLSRFVNERKCAWNRQASEYRVFSIFYWIWSLKIACHMLPINRALIEYLNGKHVIIDTSEKVKVWYGWSKMVWELPTLKSRNMRCVQNLSFFSASEINAVVERRRQTKRQGRGIVQLMQLNLDRGFMFCLPSENCHFIYGWF